VRGRGKVVEEGRKEVGEEGKGQRERREKEEENGE